MFEPIRNQRAFEAVVAQILRAIQEGDLRVGDRLKSERALSWEMQVSRPTLREGVRLLAEAGVLEVRQGAGGGMFVASEHIPAALRRSEGEMRVGDVAAVLEARRVLEPRIAQLAALHATAADFDALRETIDLMEAAVGDYERFHQLDVRFHLTIARSTRNPTLIRLARVLLEQMAAVRRLVLSGPAHDPATAVGLHRRTLAAIMAGDYAAIEDAMDEHLGYLERAWEEETGRARLRTIPAFLLPPVQRPAG